LQLTLSTRAQRDVAKREALRELIGYLEKRLSMMAYQDLIEADLVIASGIVEGVARYVVGERLDSSGMRWIPERAEALLHLRCIELNGEWERFFAWSYRLSQKDSWNCGIKVNAQNTWKHSSYRNKQNSGF
jgi:hypothetical protein